jgi:DNA repair protein RecN (Recombination protein N)
LKELDFLQIQIGEIEEAGISEEDADLEIRLKRARNQEEIRANRHELNELLEDRLVPDSQRAEKLLEQLAEFEPHLQPYLEQTRSLTAVLGELRNETNVWDEEDEDAQSLDKLEDRESTLNKLFMKYGRDVEEVLAELSRLKTRREELLDDSAGLDTRWAQLEQQYAGLLAKGNALHGARQKGVKGFAAAVKRGLRDLSMPKAEFVVENEWPVWPLLDREQTELPALSGPKLQFLFSSNLGEPVKPLTKVASGGELSRVLLALINAFQRPSRVLLVFDEIDAGLGGETAHTVGAKLAELGERHQVMCVTHFAQVARFANQQIKLEKKTAAGRTSTSLVICDYEERVAELARLMAGDAASQSLQEHARALLSG